MSSQEHFLHCSKQACSRPWTSSWHSGEAKPQRHSHPVTTPPYAADHLWDVVRQAATTIHVADEWAANAKPMSASTHRYWPGDSSQRRQPLARKTPLPFVRPSSDVGPRLATRSMRGPQRVCSAASWAVGYPRSWLGNRLRQSWGLASLLFASPRVCTHARPAGPHEGPTDDPAGARGVFGCSLPRTDRPRCRALRIDSLRRLQPPIGIGGWEEGRWRGW